MTDAPELKPCPFCGFDDAKIVMVPHGRMVNCHNCHASGPAYYHGSQGIGATAGMAAEKWNRRLPLTTHAAVLAAALKLPEVAAMRKALERIKQDAGGWPYDAACDAIAALEASHE